MQTRKRETKPFLEVHGPGGIDYRHALKNKQTLIGRLPELNDIALSPDPQKLVTRHMHCAIEKKGRLYRVVDNASKNGTFIKRFDKIQRVVGEAKLQPGDDILILAEIQHYGDPVYWELRFIDPQATESVRLFSKHPYLEYDWIQAKLAFVQGSLRTEINGLTPQEHKLIRFMEQRNRNNMDIPVMCSHEELLEAVWDEQRYTHTKNDVNRLIWGLRKKMEPDPRRPVFLVNVRGMGYRLNLHREKD